MSNINNNNNVPSTPTNVVPPATKTPTIKVINKLRGVERTSSGESININPLSPLSPSSSSPSTPTFPQQTTAFSPPLPHINVHEITPPGTPSMVTPSGTTTVKISLPGRKDEGNRNEFHFSYPNNSFNPNMFIIFDIIISLHWLYMVAGFLSLLYIPGIKLLVYFLL